MKKVILKKVNGLFILGVLGAYKKGLSLSYSLYLLESYRVVGKAFFIVCLSLLAYS